MSCGVSVVLKIVLARGLGQCAKEPLKGFKIVSMEQRSILIREPSSSPAQLY